MGSMLVNQIETFVNEREIIYEYYNRKILEKFTSKVLPIR
jgi:hypothetical protein